MSNRNGFDRAVNAALLANGLKNIIKGALVGGLKGMAVETVKSFTPQIIKITLITLIVLLLLPVIIIASLPSVLFGWSSVPSQDLRDRKEYASVMESCYARISEYRIEVVNKIIEENSNPGDNVTVIDDNTPMDIYWIIAIDGVKQRQDVYNINETKIKKLIKESLNVEVLRDEDNRYKITIVITTKTPEEIMSAQRYSEEQKNWARLMYSTVTNPQVLSNTGIDYQTGSGIDYSGVVFSNGITEVIYYSQLDSRWANTLYGRAGTIGREGCGPAALAIVVATLTPNKVTPVDVANWAAANGHRAVGSGSYHSLIPRGAEHYGLKVTGLGRGGNGQPIVDALSEGKLIIVIMNPGHFTSSGHFIVLRGVTENGKILVADPASRSRSEQEWDLGTILREARPDAAVGGPFWQIGVQ